jgi:hypothetical protein
MNDLPLFPIARSGNTRVIPESRDTFSVECASISVTDKDALVEFSIRCRDGFVHSGSSTAPRRSPNVASIGDEGPATVGGPGLHNVAVRIKILTALRTMKSPVIAC